jgi:geranylgeranyl pyrophosphate synthase
MADYYEAVGLAYQICDDVLDMRGSGPAKFGSATLASRGVGEDLRAGKVTFPLARGIALLPPSEIKEIWSSVRRGARPDEVPQIIARLDSVGAFDDNLRFAKAVVDGAWQQLLPHVRPSRAAIQARAFGWYAASRDTSLTAELG